MECDGPNEMSYYSQVGHHQADNDEDEIAQSTMIRYSEKSLEAPQVKVLNVQLANLRETLNKTEA